MEPQPPTNPNVIPGPGRMCTFVIEDDDLVREYESMRATDPGLDAFVLAAAQQMREVPWDEYDVRPEPEKVDVFQEGVVDRRSPLNPFHSPKLGKYRVKGNVTMDKVLDPASFAVPLRGRLVSMILVNGALMFIFFQELIYNKMQTGSYYAPHDENSMIGPVAMTLYELGGLNTNAVRRGEWVRLLWAMWMHSGWLHIGFNVLCQLQYMYMLEPDWGFWRTTLAFAISGITGNLLSSVVDPCKTSVGSSGGLFGLIGALCAFLVEYWNTIPRPLFLLIFSTGVGVISILTGFSQSTDSWAHIGGILAGTLFGFGTITTLQPILSSGDELRMATQGATSGGSFWRWLRWKCSPKCNCGRAEWATRIICLSTIAITWGVLFHFLFGNVFYRSLGSITFHGMEPCCCCYDLVTYDEPNKTSWTCSICDYPYFSGSPQTFEDYCNKQNLSNLGLLLPDQLFPNPLLSSSSSLRSSNTTRSGIIS